MRNARIAHCISTFSVIFQWSVEGGNRESFYSLSLSFLNLLVTNFYYSLTATGRSLDCCPQPISKIKSSCRRLPVVFYNNPNLQLVQLSNIPTWFYWKCSIWHAISYEATFKVEGERESFYSLSFFNHLVTNFYCSTSTATGRGTVAPNQYQKSNQHVADCQWCSIITQIYNYFRFQIYWLDFL